MVVRMRVVTVGKGSRGRAFSIIADKAKNLEPAFRVIAKIIREAFADEIFSEGRGTWEPLNPEYAELKLLRYGPSPMLVASGAMLDSLTQEGAINNVTVIGPSSMRVGSTDPKLPFHQSGTARTIMPRRAPINISNEVRHKWMVAIEDHIK